MMDSTGGRVHSHTGKARTVAAPPPRIIVIMDDQWPRALLRAALLEAGYDAVGARSVSEALAQPLRDPERGPVRLVVIDRHDVAHHERALDELLGLHGGPIALLLSSAGEATPAGPWDYVICRPVSIGEIVAAIQVLLPLASSGPPRD